jgi:mannose-6-phosphate isomerase-like protein (cupin superfamily)
VLSGTLQFKLDDQIVDIAGGTAFRVAPRVTRSIWNDGPDNAELVMLSAPHESPTHAPTAN